MTKPTAVPAATPIIPKMGRPINQKTNPIMNRCAHRFAASGRQCRLLTSDPSGLCAQHLAKKKAAAQSADFANFLFSRADGLKTAQGINNSLTYLYELLARDQISVRRAQTLAYITSLVLRTLPAIDHENSRGMGSAAYQAAVAKQAALAKHSAANASSASSAPAGADDVALGSAIPDPPPHTKPS